MDNELRAEALRESLKKKNKGKSIVKSKYTPKYPDSAEREYIRLTNAYMDIEKKVILSHIPEMKNIISEGTIIHSDSAKDNMNKRKLQRFETLDNTLIRLKRLFETICKELDNAFELFGLSHKLEQIASINKKLTINEWKKAVKKTLGIDLLDDYYSGDFYREALKQWTSDNVELIKTIPYDSLDKMKEIVYSSYINGNSTTDIVKEIQKQYGVDKRHAKLIARDQTGKLNAAVTKYQQQDAGVDKYEWSDSGDSRVRASHQRLNGLVFSWDNPPETDNGRRCHPGEDYQCRCCAIPVFDIDNLNLPS